ncbi:MAG TPA: hypothetical protein VF717_07810 [Pyrinomonadaceae bacterium]|jgi:hypothetical protein
MTAKLKTALFVSLLLIQSVAFAQASSRRAQIKLRGRGRSLVLMSGRMRRSLDVREQVLAARLDEVKLLFVSREGAFTYLLVDACGPSKAVPDARRCGAAEECGLLWIKLNSAWRMLDIKARNYESCWTPSSSTDGYKIIGRKLSMEYQDFSKSKQYKLSYDADEPARGFNVEESALGQSAAP